MLSWASAQFEKLSQTVAPPPTDPSSRFVYCCQRGEENEAMQLANQLPGSGVIVNPSKQQVPLHVACSHGLMQLTRQLLQQPGASWDMIDGAGNTVLHCAAMCNQPVGLDLVKMFVNELGANVCAKNYQGHTPYNVASLNSIRQYLLPIQLQQETKEALANGGTGLPPGIDMGGLKIQNSAMPPPPMQGAPTPGAPPPPQVGPPPQGMVSPQAGSMPASPYPQPPNPFAASPAPAMQGNQFNSPYPGAMPAGQPPSATAAPMQPPPPAAYNQPAAPTPRQAPAPASGPPESRDSYALTGYSSAAIYKPSPGSGGIRPDGFHSSSSDKRLAEKYGHAKVDYSHIPPPPSSGNSAGGLSGSSLSAYGNSASAPPSGGPNPYAGGLAHRQRPNRYVNYNPVTGQAPVPMPAIPRPYSSYGAPTLSNAPAPGQYSVFRPGGVGGASQTTPAPAPASAGMTPASAGMTAPAPMPPPPFQFQQASQSTEATQPSQPQAPRFAPPPIQQQTTPYQPAPFAQPPAAVNAAAVFSPPTPASSGPSQSPSPANQDAGGPASPAANAPASSPSQEQQGIAPTEQSATPQAVSTATSSRFASPPQQVPSAYGSPTKQSSAALMSPPPFTSPPKDNTPSPFASTAAAHASPADMFASPPKASPDATDTFSQPPVATPTSVPTHVPFSNRDVSGMSSVSSASDLFSKPAGISAVDAFANPPPNISSPANPVSSVEAFDQPPVDSPQRGNISSPQERSATPQKDVVETNEEEDFDQMDDVPLSPHQSTYVGGPPVESASSGVSDSIPAIGMPPPPFSSS